jgi:uncharacterized protein
VVIRYELEWDDEKARINERKHGVSFHEARSCFLDVFAIEVFDRDHSVDEDRFIIMGVSERGRVLVVAFTFRGNAMIRVISAREALPQERLEYEKQIGSR